MIDLFIFALIFLYTCLTVFLLIGAGMAVIKNDPDWIFVVIDKFLDKIYG